MEQKRRLVTRSDFDGLACAMMLRELSIIDDIKFVHPKDVQDGKIELSANAITPNLPYDPRVSLAFDHHESEVDRLKAKKVGGQLIIDPKARSAARVVYDYYGGKNTFKTISELSPLDNTGAFGTGTTGQYFAVYDMNRWWGDEEETRPPPRNLRG